MCFILAETIFLKEQINSNSEGIKQGKTPMAVCKWLNQGRETLL